MWATWEADCSVSIHSATTQQKHTEIPGDPRRSTILRPNNSRSISVWITTGPRSTAGPHSTSRAPPITPPPSQRRHPALERVPDAVAHLLHRPVDEPGRVPVRAGSEVVFDPTKVEDLCSCTLVRQRSKERKISQT